MVLHCFGLDAAPSCPLCPAWGGGGATGANIGIGIKNLFSHFKSA